MEKVMQIFYDRENDVLYISKGTPRKAVSQEIGSDVLLRVDPETDEILGFTILNLSVRFSSSDHAESIPLEIDLRALTS